ncbi:hypothetical protein HK16_06595 [Acetobacter senegalensis]|uniref:Uncharacterized protein n=2 Tax=Acetobacter TaxID=434 RepID=A0A252EKP3_9PROT|nr:MULTISPECIES: hypothetical protein [Acetobacter]ATJ90012.1 hypothetical protein CIW82_04200 [Acetobacter tropicalis]OUL66997.1 hypothetical protein HK16_06595 [Acetobacter senegalensis]
MQTPWYIPIVSVLGAVLVAIINYIFLKFRDKSDRLSKLVDNFCTEVNETAIAGSKHWLLSTKGLSDDKLLDLKEQECELVGRQERIDALFQTLKYQDKKLKLDEVQPDFDSFVTKLTGGQFRVKEREDDPQIANMLQHTAASMNGRIRRALSDRLKRFF